jgi:hypothetical protein
MVFAEAQCVAALMERYRGMVGGIRCQEMKHEI